MNRFLLLFALIVIRTLGLAQSADHSLLRSGPMVGYSDYKEVMLWVQTATAADVWITYAVKGQRMAAFSTDTVRTRKEEAFVAKLVADKVQPDNRYVYHPFWQHQNGAPGYEDWEHKLERGRIAINHALREHDTVRILSILFDRLYVLRNQLVHGGATWNSDVNRDQVRDGASLLGCLLPIFVDLMMDNPQHEWPMPNYPVVD